LFLTALEEVRQRYEFVVVGYVVMPDHIHLLIGEPEKGDPSKAMQAIKQGFARRVLKSERKKRQSRPTRIVRRRSRTCVAAAILRFQCVHCAQADREAEIYARKSGEAWIMREHG
jgi:REP element-mobilizing transposase RayT